MGKQRVGLQHSTKRYPHSFTVALGLQQVSEIQQRICVVGFDLQHSAKACFRSVQVVFVIPQQQPSVVMRLCVACREAEQMRREERVRRRDGERELGGGSLGSDSRAMR